MLDVKKFGKNWGPYDGDSIPVRKFEDAARDKGDVRPKILLISTGSFSPVHRMHVRIFHLTKDYLERRGFYVVGGWISPSHDMHVVLKLQALAVPIKHRVEMCRAACENETWIDVSTWECSQAGFVDFPSVTRKHQAFVDATFPESRIHIMFVCGADLALKCGLHRGVNRLKVAAVGRPGYSIDNLIAEKQPDEQDQGLGYFHIIESDELKDVSSTEIRRRATSADEAHTLKDLMHPAAAALYTAFMTPKPPSSLWLWWAYCSVM